eukprot:scaffold3605_cov430-Prasinococcus_capsulatus_cf.AAC.7
MGCALGRWHPRWTGRPWSLALCRASATAEPPVLQCGRLGCPGISGHVGLTLTQPVPHSVGSYVW